MSLIGNRRQLDVIESHPFRRDWFLVPDRRVKGVAEAPGLIFDAKCRAWSVHRNFLPLLDEPIPAASSIVVPSFGDKETKLRPHQVEGVKYIRSRGGTLLADQMRVGKTPQVIAAHDPAEGVLVVVGPLAVRSVWQSWYRRRWPDRQMVALTTKSYDPDRVEESDAYFMHYNVLPTWSAIACRRPIGTFVLDEAHVLAGRRSARMQAATFISAQVERTIVATGTPLWNTPASLFNLLQIISSNGWGDYKNFTMRYCGGHPGPHGWQTGPSTNTTELRQRLQEVMLRRIWGRDLAQDLEPTHYTLDRVALTADQRYEIDLAAASLSSDVEGPGTVAGALARLRRLLGTLKAPRAVELTRAVTQNEPVVVWIWHKEVAKHLAAEFERLGIEFFVINGEIQERRRDLILDDWRASERGALIISLGVGQAGIDLSHASKSIFAELDWTPAVIGQAAMRTFSPARGDEITFVVADHDVDERLGAVLAEKCEQAFQIGTPAADTAVDLINRVLGDGPIDVDMDALASRIAAQIQAQGVDYDVW